MHGSLVRHKRFSGNLFFRASPIHSAAPALPDAQNPEPGTVGEHETTVADQDALEGIVFDQLMTVEVRENARGRFLRITEEAHGRRNAIIVPSTGLSKFTAAIDEVLNAAEKAPPP